MGRWRICNARCLLGNAMDGGGRGLPSLLLVERVWKVVGVGVGVGVEFNCFANRGGCLMCQ